MNIFFSVTTCLISILWLCIDAHTINVATTAPSKVQNILKKTNITNIKNTLKSSRRILYGNEALENRPYMVYLKLPSSHPKFKEYRRWLCGGVIVHPEYILTSAACIEDVKHFYIVAGTNKYDVRDDRFTNTCIKNGARKAIWKCIPRNYIFDGHENDNVRWMNNDLAIVKVDEEFDFTKRVRGCDYIPKPVCYNNQSNRYEEPNPNAEISIAGWGSTRAYNDHGHDEPQSLIETKVVILDKQMCKRRWGRKYYNIIESYMICTEDFRKDPSTRCLEKYVDCTDMTADMSSEEIRRVYNPDTTYIHSAYHNQSLLKNGTRRQTGNMNTGGFCENDHGGPLVMGTGVNSVVIGIISACLVRESNNECYGPFLYTSVYKNKGLITCAIYKDITNCEKIFRTSASSSSGIEEHISWIGHPDGPAKNEIDKTHHLKTSNRSR